MKWHSCVYFCFFPTVTIFQIVACVLLQVRTCTDARTCSRCGVLHAAGRRPPSQQPSGRPGGNPELGLGGHHACMVQRISLPPSRVERAGCGGSLSAPAPACCLPALPSRRRIRLCPVAAASFPLLSLLFHFGRTAVPSSLHATVSLISINSSNSTHIIYIML